MAPRLIPARGARPTRSSPRDSNVDSHGEILLYAGRSGRWGRMGPSPPAPSPAHMPLRARMVLRMRRRGGEPVP